MPCGRCCPKPGQKQPAQLPFPGCGGTGKGKGGVAAGFRGRARATGRGRVVAWDRDRVRCGVEARVKARVMFKGGGEVRGYEEGRGRVQMTRGARQQRLERQCRRCLAGRRASCRRW